ncbi:MAG: S41 family peptidase [Balneolales bacterium]
MKYKKIAALVSILIISALTFGFVYTSDPYFLIKKNFTIFSEVYDEVSTRYVDEVEPERLMRHGINSMLEKLDPYTVIIDEADSQEMDIVTTGQYAGVGLEVGARADKLVVIAPIEGYSAERRGMKAGDVIIAVDGTPTNNMTMEGLQSLLRGESGSQVSITTTRIGLDEELTFDLTRERIDIKNIAYSGILDGDQRIGYVLLRRFAQNASEELRNAVLEMKEGGELDGLILDLRNNPGGLLDEAVYMVDKFVSPGHKVVQTKGRMPETNSVYSTEEPAILNKPLVVLQNNGSASSSEIVSGALQDLDKAVIIGDRSFGKGLVQIIRPLSYNLAIKITTSKYYTPSGRSIQSHDYSSVENPDEVEVPDSLRTPFKTLSGRTVYEGIGIEPDIQVDDGPQSLLEVALLQNSHYFFFANQYASENPEFDLELVDEALFDSFQVYLEKEEFNYKTRSEHYYTEFTESLDDEIRKNAQAQLTRFEEIVNEEKQLQMEQNAEKIKQELFLELLSRYEGTTGKLKHSLKYDESVQEGIRLLANPEEYKSILNITDY